MTAPRRDRSAATRARNSVGFTLSESDAKTFEDFMSREGFPNRSSAARALVFASIEAWPQFGIMLAERRSLVYGLKARAFMELSQVFKRIEAELEEELRADRDAAATKETARAVVNLELEKNLR